MKFKTSILFVALIIFSLLLVGCSAKNFRSTDSNEDDKIITKLNSSIPNRKIIYTVNADLKTDNLSDSITKIKSELNSDEWFDSEDISEDSAIFVIRVKSEHLEQFLDSITEGHEVTNFNKTAKDVSLDYQDKSNLLLTYQTERERLLELYEGASLADMITINTRLSEIDIEISKLQGELNEFDNLVEYSVVNLNIYVSNDTEPLTFGQRITNAISGGFLVLVAFLETLLIIFIVLIPWAIVIVPSIYGIYRLTKYKKNKKINKMNAQINIDNKN